MRATVSFSISFVGAATKIASALSAANAMPRGDAPAWKMTGVRCGDGSEMWMPGTVKCLPSWSIWCTFEGSREDAGLAVAHDGVVFPRPFPQLVEHLEVLVGLVVAVVVLELVVVAHVAGGARQVAGDHVPADPPLGQVVEGAHAPSERVRMLVGGAGGDAEAQVLGDGGHRRDQQQRIVDRYLRALPMRCVVIAAVHVVGAQHIGDEQAVESCHARAASPGPSSTRCPCSWRTGRRGAATARATGGRRSSCRRR